MSSAAPSYSAPDRGIVVRAAIENALPCIINSSALLRAGSGLLSRLSHGASDCNDTNLLNDGKLDVSDQWLEEN